MASLQHVVRVNCGNAISSSVCVSGMRRNNDLTTPRNRSLANLNGQIECYPGIITEKPKHPDYAIKGVRQSSFSGWCSDVIDPAQLSEAGFFNTGIKDCVRCFFCGGGMKNWERGDNAWIEHARWFPNCAYVKLFKGEDFVNMCRMANIGAISNDQVLQNQELLEWYVENNRQNVEDQLIEALNSTAAKLVMNMGYNQEIVEKAINGVRQKYGTTELRAQCILEFLLDNNYSPNFLPEVNATASFVRTTSHTSNSNISSEKSPTSTALQRLREDVLEENKNNEDQDERNDPVSLPDIPDPNLIFRNSNYILPEETTQFAITNLEAQNSEEKQMLEEKRRLRELITCKICLDL
ncbi:baculoviral IAP repeat-containing protein 2-like isoform X1 [Mercenaria mercenaria]|uniref:baculoviral IAP repeat-containing protein 2-like isoform X1 n=1 Tax=Mercenaria mercenaria TaxID=6596 RepID=UPI00234EAC1A|nr:baculoviral IAP repeat-containing protein 2-like isoform X1 [Mercenaria mercenaria]